MDDERRIAAAVAGLDQAISRLRGHVAALVEGRRVEQDTLQEAIDTVFGPDETSMVAGLKNDFETAELALRICVEVGAPRSSMRAHQRECDRILDALVYRDRS